ncbi:MAG: fatty acid oxidation complex subunit alpha FadJ [Gammaproteobacteria bacterium]|nr:fatty acid oxidation complex subunit alpha FadJ [Gammaproteobacteria bacterium]
MTSEAKTFSLSVREDGIALVTIDVAGEAMNTLKAEFGAEIGELFAAIRADKAIKGVVLISGKPDNFVAGADINMLKACKTAEGAEQLSRMGHATMAELGKLGVPVVAAIHGPALGGGLELALACHARVCTDDAKTVLGLPEVQLGLLPGSGGTQRLPRLVGIAAALDMMLTGKQLRAKQAKKIGLVDEVVPKSILLEAAVKKAKYLAGKNLDDVHPKPGILSQLTSIPGITKLALEENAYGRKILWEQARKKLLAKTRGNYPAPERIVDAVEAGIEQGAAAGYEAEAKGFGQLVVSPQAAQLMNIFFATTEMKKDRMVAAEPRALHKIGVLGGGLMGAGIAYVTIDKAKLPVRLKDANDKGVNHGLGYSWKLINERVKRRHMTKTEASARLSQLTGTTDFSGFKGCDMVVEAVFEDLKLKHQMVADIERECGPDTIFATNTSSLPIASIAEASAKPENVIGLHYFSPVDKMPLLEIIKTDKTAPEVIATGVEFGKKQGKTVIVVNDGAGFYVNRILAPYMNEAGRILVEGVRVEQIDKSLLDFGFPVGPITLLDEVGIDVATKVGPILEKAFGERMAAPAAFARLLDDDRKGKKNGKGFYVYGPKVKKGAKDVDESVYSVLGIKPGLAMDKAVLAERCVLLMVNEAARCLDEGIIASARDGDIGAIFGIGFPPFLGGPFRYADSLGLPALVDKLETYAAKLGERFQPAELLKRMAAENRRFYG